jgi:PAS domain S-box-containing protein
MTDRRVLIVDDDVDFADSLRDLLEAEEYQIKAANNARDAVMMAEAFAPHVVLIDIRLRLGQGDGLDLLATLKQKHPDLLCIVMTAYADVETAIKALQSDAYDYLRKPLFFQELATTLDRCFEKIELERKNQQAMAALRAGEERYRSIVENALEGIFRSTPAAGFIDVNPALVHMLGYDSKEEVLALDLEKDLYADPRDRQRVFDQHRSRAAVRGLEVTWKRKQGEHIIVSLNSQAIHDAAGQFLFYEGLVQDVTERKRAEDTLRDYAERLETLRGIDQAIIRAQSPGEIAQAALRCIRRLVPCMGACLVTVDFEARQATLLAIDADGESDIRETELHLSLEALGDSARVVEQLRRGELGVIANDPDYSLLPSEIQALWTKEVHTILGVPLTFQETLIGFLALGVESADTLSENHVEITQEVADQLVVAIQNARLLEAERRRGAELEALHQASLHLTSSLEQQLVLEAIIEHALKLVSADNAHIFLYDGACLTFGAAIWAGGLQRKPYAVPQPNGLTHTVARTGEQRIIPNVDADLFFQDQQWGSAVACLPLCISGEVRGVMNIAFEQPHVFGENELNVLKLLADQAAIAIHNAELHQQMRLHADELAAALARQEELDRLKSEFIQNVSHELRSPLALIRGYAEVLVDDELGELQQEQRKPIETIVRRSRMLSDLVEDITLILGAETRPLEQIPVSPDEVARTAVEDFRVAVDQAGLKLQAEIVPRLPPVSGSLTYLRRVMDNLLSNALKFTPEGGTITVRAWQEGKQVALEVQDSGIGIPAEQLERIFERFYQVDGSARRRYGGVGLGLALVKEIVSLHGGQVTVKSQVGEGSTFTVTLPIREG